MFNYLIYGWKLQSDFELSQLPIWNRADGATPDLVIERGNIAEEFAERVSCFADIHEDKTLFSNYMLHMIIENGEKITYELLEGANLQYINSYFVGWGMAIVAFQKGQTAIHCSALANENGAILISGESGSGKSTLCNHLLEKNFSFMADDIAVADIIDGQAGVYPTFPFQKLCRNVVDARGLNYDDLIYIDEEKDKFLVPVKNTFHNCRTPINCLIFLTLSDSDKVICRELSGVEKFIVCNKAVFFNRLFKNRNMPPKAGALCLDLAETIRIFMIARPARMDTQAEVNRLADEIIKPCN